MPTKLKLKGPSAATRKIKLKGCLQGEGESVGKEYEKKKSDPSLKREDMQQDQ